MGKNCAIPGCPNEKYTGKYLKGFGFPQDAELSKRWLEIIQLHYPQWEPTKFPRFCTLHFDKSDIIEGKNHKLQYRAVPMYFNTSKSVNNAKSPTQKKQKLSQMIRELNHNQILYSSDSDSEYQIILKVHKVPREKNFSAQHLRCVYCNVKKSNAISLQEHLSQSHGLEVDILTPADVVDDMKLYHIGDKVPIMCSECGLVFKETPNDVVQHIQTSHLDTDTTTTNDENPTPIFVEEVEQEEVEQEEEELFEEVFPVEYEYVYEEAEVDEEENQIKYVIQEVEEQQQPEDHDEVLIEETVRTTFKCKICSIDFMTKEDIKDHINEAHCIASNNQHQVKQEIKVEIDQPHTEEVVEDKISETYEPTCYICYSTFSSLAAMRKHIRQTHKTNKCYFCTHCNEKFTSLDDYEDHECLEEVLQ